MVAELAPSRPLRRLTMSDLDQLRALTSADPVTHLYVEHRLETASLDSPWFGGQILGRFIGDTLVGGCHTSTNVVPFGDLDEATLDAIAVRLRRKLAASVVGTADLVVPLWSRLEPMWGAARSVRPVQPLLSMGHAPVIQPDPRVRRVLIDEFETIYPACVAMFTEEVGTDPERGNREGYRARVSHLIAQGWSFAIIEDDEVLFKAEVGAATKAACQLQGVYVAPRMRGTGLAAPALAAVVQQAQQSIAPIVSLYVNDYNLAARRAYATVGFEQVGTFATVLM